jgi:tetratricopeptide (TPR) repeat protein
MGRDIWRVFVSHTLELRDYPASGSYVQAVERAIAAAGHVIVDMKDFPAIDQAAAQVCRERVRSCQVFVGVLGTRYGSPVRDQPNVSYTELEFDAASEAGIPRLMFLLNTDATDLGIPPKMLIDLDFGDRQDTFRQRVRASGLMTKSFSNPDDLGRLVYQSLRDLADTQRRVDSGLIREQVPAEPQPAHTSRFLNPPPVPVPVWFQDRVIETGLLVRDVADPVIRMVTVVGRGGIGKTAMVCRLLKGLQVGKVPDMKGDLATLRASGIIYLSPDGIHQVRYTTLITDLIRLLPARQARPLEHMAHDPQTAPTVMMCALLENFPAEDQAGAQIGPVVVLLDNLESVMDAATETLTEPALDEALRALLTAPTHAVTVIATTRVTPTDLLRVESARQKRRLLDEGLGREDAQTVLKELDDDGRLGLHDAPATLLGGLWQHTRGFPRALEAVTAILDGDPSLTPADLLDRTRHLPEDRVIEVLVGEAYQLLDPAAQQVMQALAVFPAPVSEVGIDYLLQPVNPTVNAASILTRLARRHLARVHQAHYHLHPIDRAYALTQLPQGAGDDPTAGLTLAALRARAADYYAEIRTQRGSWQTLDDISAQLAEFELRCDGAQYDTAATVLVGITEYLHRWGQIREALALHQRLNGHLTDPQDQADNHLNLGNCYADLGQLDTAIDHHQQALTINRDTGNRNGEAANLDSLGNCYAELGQTDTAIDHHQQALTINRDTGNRQGEACNLGNLGNCYYELGQLDTAIDRHQQALTIDREIGYRQGEASDLSNLGNCYAELGQTDTAIDHYQQALTINREIGYRQGEAGNLSNLGNCYAELGQTDTAIDHYQQALTINRGTGYRYGEAINLCSLGEARVDQQAWTPAADLYREAIGIGDQTGNAQVRSSARVGLAQCLLLNGDPGGCLDRAFAAAELAYADDKAMIALLAGIARLKLGQPDQAATAFFRAVAHADARLKHSMTAYAAFDTRALALSGLAATGDPAALPDAVGTFHRARHLTTAAGIVARTLRLLDQIAGTRQGHDLDIVRTAAAGAQHQTGLAPQLEA